MVKKRNSHSIAALARAYRLNLLYLFGSIARGDIRRGSDIDIAYRAARPLTPKEQSTLATALGALFKEKGRTVDLVDIATAPPLLRYQIAREGRKLHGSTADDEAFVRNTHKDYIDARPIFEATQSYVHAALNL